MRNLRLRLASSPIWRGYRLEWIVALLAATGLGLYILSDFQVRALQSCGSDFKTVYASAANMAHGANAYTFENIAQIFTINGVTKPVSWYGHGPVYPPFTIVMLTPLAAIPMVSAVYLWSSFSAILLGCALGSLARVAGEEFSLARIWRVVLCVLGAAFPLSGFGLEMGNVSVVASSLCILAVTASPGSIRWPRALGLGIALILKPHLAIWVLVSLLLIDNRWRRRLAFEAAGIASGLAVAGGLILALTGQLGMQMSAFQAMLHFELGASMSGRNHELLSVPAQILSFDSLVGYFPHGENVEILLVGGILLFCAVALLWASKQSRLPATWRFPITAAWCCFGMLASYHRAHDGVVLLLLLPWILACLRDSWKRGQAIVMLVACMILSIDPSPDVIRHANALGDLHPLAEFLLYRQAALAALILAVTLLTCVCGLVYQRRARRIMAQDRSAALEA